MTPYEVLGVPPDASQSEITSAYRVLVQILHPDRFHGCSDAVRREAERRMREANEAYAVLRALAKSRANGRRADRRPVEQPFSFGTPWEHSAQARMAQARRAEEDRQARLRSARNGEARARPRAPRAHLPKLSGLGEALVTNHIRCRGCDSVQWLPDGWRERLGDTAYFCSECEGLLLCR